MKKIIILYALIFVLTVNLVLAYSLMDLVGFNIFEKPPKNECMHSCKEIAKAAKEQCETEDTKQEIKECRKEAKLEYKKCKKCCNDEWKDCKEEAKQAKDACKESGKSTKECSDLAKELTNSCEFNCNVPTSVCGNGICETGEDLSTCEVDCGVGPG